MSIDFSNLDFQPSGLSTSNPYFENLLQDKVLWPSGSFTQEVKNRLLSDLAIRRRLFSNIEFTKEHTENKIYDEATNAIKYTGSRAITDALFDSSSVLIDAIRDKLKSVKLPEEDIEKAVGYFIFVATAAACMMVDKSNYYFIDGPNDAKAIKLIKDSDPLGVNDGRLGENDKPKFLDFVSREILKDAQGLIAAMK